MDLTTSLKNNCNSVIVSGIVPFFDNLNNKATEFKCFIHFLHLNESKMYLNFNGVKVFAENISAFLTKFD